MTDHDPRCERSASDPKRCRCESCQGRLHGVQAPGIVGRLARNRRDGVLPTMTAAELLGQQLAAYRDAALAEGVPL